MTDGLTGTELIRRERDLITDLGIERPPWRFKRGRRGGTRSLESFSYALSMPDAPTALAMLRAYVTAAGLDQSEGWGVSAMPSWAGPTDHQRFATIAGGGIELFYVWFESASGLVSEWGARFPADLAPQRIDPERVSLSTADNGDTGVHGETLDDLIATLDDPEFLRAITTTQEARATSRRADWHNPYLGALLGASDAPIDEEVEPVTTEDVEFERRYIERVTRQRLHQGPLRAAALRRYGARCMYCGLDIEEVLEAAHIIPDSAGGAASTDNIRILCANHHTAFDAGLIVLVDDKLAPAEGAREVPPRHPMSTIAIPERERVAENEPDDEDPSGGERYQWIITDPYELVPGRLGDTVLYEQMSGNPIYVEGTLLGMRFLSKDLSHPLDITYELDIQPADQNEPVTVTVSCDGYVSRYIDNEDPEDW